MNKDSLAVVMPVYNEEGAISKVIEKWSNSLKALNIDYQIHAYNDGSKDNTSLILHKLSDSSDNKLTVHDKINSGHGPTILQAYRENADKYEWIFQIDSDDEMGPDNFNILWEHRNDYDFLIGRRDGRVQPLPRKIVSFISRLSVNLFYGKSIWDVNSPYRLMRSAKFREIYSKIPQNTFAPNVIISGCLGKMKLKYYEYPVPYQDRQTGEVSIKKWKILKVSLKSFIQTIKFSMTQSWTF